MEQYLIRRKRNGQFSKKGKVITTDGKIEIVKLNYWDTFNWSRLYLILLIVAVIIYLIVKG